MSGNLRLMCVLAHPDDESLGFGGTLAKYAREGVETYLVTATRGERGRFGDAAERPAPEVVGEAREAELRAAAAVLGVREVALLGYLDGALDQADPVEAQARIAEHLRRVRPHVVLTFGPDGAYGHPDHIAISQFTTAAVASSNAGVSKLYYLAWSRTKWDAYQGALKRLVSRVDGVERQANPWPEWAITTVIETGDVSTTVWDAVRCHRTQMSIYRGLAELPAELHRGLWGTQEFYRAMSVVNGGRRRETDVFEGLR